VGVDLVAYQHLYSADHFLPYIEQVKMSLFTEYSYCIHYGIILGMKP
jgi:hypothetical protein